MLSQKYYYTRIGQANDLKNAKERAIYRIFETLPAILAWGTLLGTIFLSYFAPVFAAIFIIAFDTYWFLKTIYLSLHLRSAFNKMRKNMKINWFQQLTDNQQLTTNDWKEIYHLIILPFYKESEKTIKAAINSIYESNYPKDKIMIILAAEERACQAADSEYDALKIAQKIQEEFSDKFFKFLITIHPENLPEEIPGKGSNIAWAAKKTKEEIIDLLKIPYDKIIVSAFDIDTVVYPDYFARLTYVYLNTANPQKYSYQPVPFYTNNIWQASALARVVAFSATFWHTLQQERAERLTTFSSHSMAFQTLVDVNFWQTNMVSEDSRIFWQALLRYNGDYGVIPLYYPIKMDANMTPSFLKTMKNLYKQQRRWSWGCENIPYILFGFLKNKEICFRKKMHYVWIYIEGFWSWATNVLIIFLLGWLPVTIGSEEFKQTLLSYNLPQITHWIMTLATIGIITSAYLTMIILPQKPPEYGRHKYLIMILQWPLLLITMIIFGALPAIESQTRLMFGKKFRLGFWVTPKD